MTKKDEAKEGELIPRDDTFVTGPITPKPTGGRVSNAIARWRFWSTGTTHKAKTFELQAQTELYDAAVAMEAALARARDAEIHFDALPEIMVKNREEFKLRLETEHNETMRELRNRSEKLELMQVNHEEEMQNLRLKANSLKLSKAQADLAIEQGFLAVSAARKEMRKPKEDPIPVKELSPTERQERALQAANDSRTRKMEAIEEIYERDGAAAKSERDAAVAEAHRAQRRAVVDTAYDREVQAALSL